MVLENSTNITFTNYTKIAKMTVDAPQSVERNSEMGMEKELMNSNEEAILRQIEYYFSEANFPRDKFLLSLVDTDGYVAASEILSFKKLQSLGCTEEIFRRVVKIHSDQLELDHSETKIKRKVPLPTNCLPHKKNAFRSTSASALYVGNLHQDVDEELLWELMLQAGPLKSVYMPVDKETGKHKGYGFADYEK
eukprot:Colp12_sorted_trinity150504_noHs@1335